MFNTRYETEAQRTERIEASMDYQDALTARADEILDAEIAKGAAFTEGLCNWALNRAMEQVEDNRPSSF